MERYRLVDSATDKKEKRTDHTFTWEDPAFQAGQARARIRAEVLGDQVTGPWRFLKLPEAWLRDFYKPRLAGLLLPGMLGAAGLLLLIGFVRRLSQRGEHHYHWPVYFGAAAAGAVATTLSALNQWPVWLGGYDTAKPLENYYTEFLIGRSIWVVLAGSGLFLAVFAADVFLQMTAGHREVRRPSIPRASAIFVAVWGALGLLSGTDRWIPGDRHSLPLWNLPGADTVLPGGAALIEALMTAVTTVCLLVIAVSAAHRYRSPRGRLLLVVAASLVFAASTAQHPAQFAWSLLESSVLCGLLITVVCTCAVDLVTFGIALFWVGCAGPATTLIRQPAPFLRWNGIVCAAVAVLLGILLALRFRHARHRSIPYM
jgi:hypothetical protein